MNEVSRQYHYSVRHWNKQFRDVDRYIDKVNAETDKLEGRMPWGWWPDRGTGLTPSITPSTVETITRLHHLKYLRASASDRLRYAHVMRFKMCNDKLLFNGIAFDTMLEDERKALHARIDESRKRIEADIAERNFNESLKGMSITRRALTIMQRIGRHTRPESTTQIKDIVEAGLITAPKPIPPFELGGTDNTGKEEHPRGIVRDQVSFLPAGFRVAPGYRIKSPLIYGPGGEQLQKIPDSAEIVLRHMEHHRPKVYFVCTLAQWHENLPGVVSPKLYELVKIKKQIWKRVL